MKIRMTKSIRGSLNGVTVDDLAEGKDYETENSPRGERMGQSHISNYVAIELDVEGNPVIAEIVEPVDSLGPVAELEPEPEPEPNEQ